MIQKSVKLLITFSFFTHTVCSQVLIPRVGYTSSRTTSNAVNSIYNGEVKTSDGYLVGVGTSLKIKSMLTAQIDLQYVKKGQEQWTTIVDPGIVTSVYIERYVLNYLEIPIMIRIRFNDRKISPFLETGFSVACGLNGTRHFIRKSYVPSGGSGVRRDKFDIRFGKSTNQEEGHNRLETGLQFGAGIFFFKKVELNARYHYGLSSIVDSKTQENRVMQISVGVPLELIKNK